MGHPRQDWTRQVMTSPKALLAAAAFSPTRILLRALAVCALIAAGLAPAICLAQTTGSTTKSISNWVSTCDPSVDQRDNVAKAFAAAANNAFVLVVDCPVFIHVGEDIGKPIFVDSGVQVKMTGKGKFIVDNVFVPTFVIANSNDVTFADWRVQYIGSMPTDPRTGGYTMNGVFASSAASDPAAVAFHDRVLTPWLAANRGITFGGTKTVWTGPTSSAATFHIIGASSHFTISDMVFNVPPGADVQHLIPVAFDFDAGFKNGVTATTAGLTDPKLIAIPDHVSIDTVTLDGAYMGFAGEVSYGTFNNITSIRYGDLQKPDNTDLGGVGKWFAPPHLFYMLAVGVTPTNNITISNVTDEGVRLGVARDTSASNLTGYALSLKIGANHSTVSNYTSLRPDGLVDVLQSNGLTLSNVRGRYNSAFLHNFFPGVRFPNANMHNITLNNVYIRDDAPVSAVPPVGNVTDAGSDHIVLEHVTVTVNSLANGVSLVPKIYGAGSSTDVTRVPAQSVP
jgi:hypothetical protein